MRDAKVFLAIVAGVVAFALVAAYASWGAVIALWVVAGAAGGIRARRWALRTHEARRLINEADVQHEAWNLGVDEVAIFGRYQVDGHTFADSRTALLFRSQPDYIGRLETETVR